MWILLIYSWLVELRNCNSSQTFPKDISQVESSSQVTYTEKPTAKCQSYQHIPTISNDHVTESQCCEQLWWSNWLKFDGRVVWNYFHMGYKKKQFLNGTLWQYNKTIENCESTRPKQDKHHLPQGDWRGLASSQQPQRSQCLRRGLQS